jgi:hypothetical protein
MTDGNVDMKIIDLYNIIERRFPQKVDAGLFSDPLAQGDVGVQFVNQYGISLPPIIANPASYMVQAPFAGPFYQMAVFGMTLAVTEKPLPDRKFVMFFVRDMDDQVYVSAALGLTVSVEDLKGLSSEFGIKWYANEIPIRLPEFSNLDDLIIYEYERNAERFTEYARICGENSGVQPDRGCFGEVETGDESGSGC